MYDKYVTGKFPVQNNIRFLPEDIVTMLAEYEKEHHTGMDMQAAAQELYRVTGGYPYLVSCLCKKLDETGMGWDAADLWMFLSE